MTINLTELERRALRRDTRGFEATSNKNLPGLLLDLQQQITLITVAGLSVTQQITSLSIEDGAVTADKLADEIDLSNHAVTLPESCVGSDQLDDELDLSDKTVSVASPQQDGEAANRAYVQSVFNGVRSWLAPILAVANDPEAEPVAGHRYIVGDEPTGDFVEHEDEIAQYDGDAEAWTFTAPEEGYALWNLDTDLWMVYGANGWADFGTAIRLDAVLDGVLYKKIEAALAAQLATLLTYAEMSPAGTYAKAADTYAEHPYYVREDGRFSIWFGGGGNWHLSAQPGCPPATPDSDLPWMWYSDEAVGQTPDGATLGHYTGCTGSVTVAVSQDGSTATVTTTDAQCSALPLDLQTICATQDGLGVSAAFVRQVLGAVLGTGPGAALVVGEDGLLAVQTDGETVTVNGDNELEAPQQDCARDWWLGAVEQLPGGGTPGDQCVYGGTLYVYLDQAGWTAAYTAPQ